MNQALHIFRKDVRRLRWEILAALAVTALFVWAQPHYTWQTLYDRVLSAIDVSNFVLLAWCYLVARVVHEEPLVGDTEFWLSRPYSWKSLLAAKILFIAVFIGLPSLATQCAILWANGLPVFHLSSLLIKQGELFALVLLPAAALAAMTRGLAQFTLAGLAVVLYWCVFFFLWTATPVWLIVYVISVLLVLAAALIILILQYRWRRKTASLAVVACAGILILFSLSPLVRNTALAWEYPAPKSVAGGSSVSLDFDSSQRYQEQEAGGHAGMTTIRIPLRVSGLPDGTNLQSDAVKVTIETSTGLAWRSPWMKRAESWSGRPSKFEDKAFADVYVDSEFYEHVASQPVTLRISLALTLFQEQSTSLQLLPHSFSTKVPNVGLCFFQQGQYDFSNSLPCRSAFVAPTRVWIRAQPESLCPLSSNGALPTDLTEYRRRMSEATIGPFVRTAGLNPLSIISALRREDNPLSDTNFLNPVKNFSFTLPTPEFAWSGGDVRAWPCAGTELIFATRKPLVHFHRELEIHGVQLIDYTPD